MMKREAALEIKRDKVLADKEAEIADKEALLETARKENEALKAKIHEHDKTGELPL